MQVERYDDYFMRKIDIEKHNIVYSIQTISAEYIMPLFKLTTMALRTISKPVAGYMKNQLKDNQFFTKTMTDVGRGYQKTMNKFYKNDAPQISIERAIDIGSELVVEASVFAFFGGLLIYDSLKSKMNADARDKRIIEIDERLKKIEKSSA